MCRSTSLLLSIVLLIPPVAASPLCEVRSGPYRNPVIELYTSEGCSSCPPADRWLSRFAALPKDEPLSPVVLAFHVSYWDYIGWIDRFAQPVFNERQRELARRERRSSVYTPQVVRDGMDWPRWHGVEPRSLSAPTRSPAPAGASILLRRSANGLVQASVTPVNPAARWEAYWAVTEDGHATKVKAGENKGEALRHDFVVRQFETVPAQAGPARLAFQPAPSGEHARRVSLVVVETDTGKPLQGLSLNCAEGR